MCLIDELDYYIDTYRGSSGSPVILVDAGPNPTTVTDKDGKERRIAEQGYCIIVGVHRMPGYKEEYNTGMIFKALIDKL